MIVLNLVVCHTKDALNLRLTKDALNHRLTKDSLNLVIQNSCLRSDEGWHFQPWLGYAPSRSVTPPDASPWPVRTP